jgi:hypothetical protein
MNEKQPVYAVIRIDKYLVDLPGPIEEVFAVQSILPTLEEAKSEVERLNLLRDPDRVTYVWRATRFYPNGRDASRTLEEE